MGKQKIVSSEEELKSWITKFANEGAPEVAYSVYKLPHDPSKVDSLTNKEHRKIKRRKPKNDETK
jgi:hypothetical protein